MVGTFWLLEVFCGAIDPPPHPMLTIKPANKNTNADVRRKNRMEVPSR
jgi:hypothetical protein